MSQPAPIADGRQVLTAFNEATSLREVLVREIRALGALWVVGKRRPISDLDPAQQQLVREAYRDTGWASDYGVELQGIYTSRELAEEECKRRGANWFLTRLPIDSCLPEDVVFGEWAHQFPGSSATPLYENITSATKAIRVTVLRAFEDEISRLQTQLEAVRELIHSP